MSKALLTFSMLICLLSTTLSSQVTIYSSGTTANWNDPSAWNPKRVPNSTDVVQIDGEVVNIDGITAEVKGLIISNSEPSHTALNLLNGAQLNVTNLLSAENRNPSDVEINLSGNSKLYTQDLLFKKDNESNNSNKLTLTGSDGAYIQVSNNFQWKSGMSAVENHTEISLIDNAQLIVNNNSILSQYGTGYNLDISLNNNAKFKTTNEVHITKSGGNEINISLNAEHTLFSAGQLVIAHSGGSGNTTLNSQGGTFLSNGNVTIQNSQTNQHVELIASGPNSKINFKKNISFFANSEADILFTFKNKSELILGGNFTRAGGYGNLSMEPNTTLVFDGSSAQSVPTKAGTAGDSFTFGKMEFKNTSGAMIELNEDLHIESVLTLTAGIINSQPGKMVIIGENAMIEGGSSDKYISGPVKKIGLNPGENFTFPIGHLGTFAPITINNHDNNVDSDGEFITKYDNCPPPYGNVASGQVPVALDHVSQLESWTLERSIGSPDIDVRIHWTDATASGISDTSQLVVAMYDNAASEWVNIGRSGLQGSAAPGMSGSIRNDIFCPPPYGNTRFTFGSIAPQQDLLPVVLTNFVGRVIDNAVALSWTTSQEIGTKQFVVESSSDGINFSRIAAVQAQINSNVKHLYLSTDDNPKVGVNYYRLRQMDLNGFFTFSKVISVEYNNDVQISVFPNPIVDYITVKGNIPDHSNNPVKVFDQLGRLIYTGFFPSTAGMIHIDSEEFQLNNKGIYYLQVDIDGTLRSLEIIKS